MTKQAVWDAEKRKFVQKDDGQGNPSKTGNGHTVWYGVTGDELKTLTEFAKADGFDLKSDTDTGKKAKVGKAVKQYVQIAVQELIQSRKTSNQPKSEVKSK